MLSTARRCARGRPTKRVPRVAIQLSPSAPSRPMELTIMTNTGDTETLMLELWSNRNSAEKIKSICAKLIELAPKDLEKVEMYLPQFAHMIIALPSVLPTVAPIEKFVLSVCQLSIHIVRARKNKIRIKYALTPLFVSPIDHRRCNSSGSCTRRCRRTASSWAATA